MSLQSLLCHDHCLVDVLLLIIVPEQVQVFCKGLLVWDELVVDTSILLGLAPFFFWVSGSSFWLLYVISRSTQ